MTPEISKRPTRAISPKIVQSKSFVKLIINTLTQLPPSQCSDTVSNLKNMHVCLGGWQKCDLWKTLQNVVLLWAFVPAGVTVELTKPK